MALNQTRSEDFVFFLCIKLQKQECRIVSGSCCVPLGRIDEGISRGRMPLEIPKHLQSRWITNQSPATVSKLTGRFFQIYSSDAGQKYIWLLNKVTSQRVSGMMWIGMPKKCIYIPHLALIKHAKCNTFVLVFASSQLWLFSYGSGEMIELTDGMVKTIS